MCAVRVSFYYLVVKLMVDGWSFLIILPVYSLASKL